MVVRHVKVDFLTKFQNLFFGVRLLITTFICGTAKSCKTSFCFPRWAVKGEPKTQSKKQRKDSSSVVGGAVFRLLSGESRAMRTSHEKVHDIWRRVCGKVILTLFHACSIMLMIVEKPWCRKIFSDYKDQEIIVNLLWNYHNFLTHPRTLDKLDTERFYYIIFEIHNVTVRINLRCSLYHFSQSMQCTCIRSYNVFILLLGLPPNTCICKHFYSP